MRLLINLAMLETEIAKMTPRSQLFKVLKRALKCKGYWKNHPRGNPSKGWQAFNEGKV